MSFIINLMLTKKPYQTYGAIIEEMDAQRGNRIHPKLYSFHK